MIPLYAAILSLACFAAGMVAGWGLGRKHRPARWNAGRWWQ